jgi:hypothetical protein
MMPVKEDRIQDISLAAALSVINSDVFVILKRTKILQFPK